MEARKRETRGTLNILIIVEKRYVPTVAFIAKWSPAGFFVMNNHGTISIYITLNFAVSATIS